MSSLNNAFETWGMVSEDFDIDLSFFAGCIAEHVHELEAAKSQARCKGLHFQNAVEMLEEKYDYVIKHAQLTTEQLASYRARLDAMSAEIRRGLLDNRQRSDDMSMTSTDHRARPDSTPQRQVWSELDLKRLVSLFTDGLSNGEIAQALGRSTSAISGKLSLLGLKRPRPTHCVDCNTPLVVNSRGPILLRCTNCKPPSPSHASKPKLHIVED